jgi:hypothetical protein
MPSRRGPDGAGRKALARPAGGDAELGRRFWIGAAAGGLVMLHGLAGLVRQAASTRPGAWAVWLLAILAAHDLVLVPAVLLSARLLRRGAGSTLWPPLRAALVAGGIVLLITAPALLGDGRSTDPTNPTLLPNDYPRSLALVIGLILAAAGAWAVLATRPWRQTPKRPPPRPSTSASAATAKDEPVS